MAAVSAPATLLRASAVRALLAIVLAAGYGCASRPATSAASPVSASLDHASAASRPALVVMIVVDQLGENLLERYDSLYSGGFHRLLASGHVYRRASHDHFATKTAVGHATLSTGVYPSRHGIIANEWQEQVGRGWMTISNVGDSNTRIIGQPKLAGVSPHYLERTGLADWITAADPASQVASVSGKDRGAVLPAAHAKGQVYWFEGTVGRFVTSTYYRAEYPVWVTQFNDREVPEYRADSVWAEEVPARWRARTDPDTNAAEGDGIHSFFPHRFSDEGHPGAFWDWFASTPALDSLTIQFAERMVQSMRLGRGTAPDFLNVSLSATDRVGHAYSPRSREQLDNLLRLDRELGAFFDFLDERVGKDRWVVALTADHGAPDSPEDRAARGDYGHRATPAEHALMDSVRADADQHRDDPSTPARLVAALARLPFVAHAWTYDSLTHAAPADSFAFLAMRSIYPGRAGGEFGREGIEVQFVDGFLDRARGIDHGSPYWHDRHVPLIFLGDHVSASSDSTPVATVDLAPTFARMLGVPFPGDLDGHPLTSVISH
jgi:arylsulfatase A-like enzyme